MKKLHNFIASEHELLNKHLDLNEIDESISELKTEKLFRMTKNVTNLAAEFKEVEKLIILIDIVGFSKDTTRNQVYKIYLFQRYLMAQLLGNKLSFSGKIRINHFVPTGDGCYIIAEKCPQELALSLLLQIISGFKNLQTENGISLSLRASALIGKVVPFVDMAHHINFIGEGMNEASRILSGGQKELESHYLNEHPGVLYGDEKKYSRNSLFLGDSLASSIENYKEYCLNIFNYKDVPDKHGMKRNITVLQGIL